MNNYRDIITIEPGKRSGQPCIRGMRITVYDVFEYLASGMTVAEVLHDFPELTETDIRACFAYAAAKEKSEKNDIDKHISKQYNSTWNCSKEYRTEIATHEHTIEISNLADYINQIDQITDPEKSYLYRGQENAAWRVTSSAYRRLEKQTETGTSEQQSDTETDLLLETESNIEPNLLTDLFVGYLTQIVDEVKLKYPSTYRDLTPLECMAHLQHNRVATGLIDFTFSPLVALWFACGNRENTNGKVFVLENDNDQIKEITTLESLQRDLDVFFATDQAQWYLWTPTLDSRAVDIQRMTTQQSAFLFGMPEVETGMIAHEIVVRTDRKENLRIALEKLGISEKTLFSDLLGFFERNSHSQPYDRTLAEPYYGGHRDEK